MKIDLTILNDYIENGLVLKNNHVTLPIAIYNYSRETQYESKWDYITLMCRGLVLDNEGNVIAKAFNKFFNLEEHKPEEIPNEPFEVYEKLDGSLGILFHYNGEWVLATKGSFTSNQSVRGLEMLKKYDYERLISGFTYLFEIIYDENRIVCQYNYEDLILLSVFDNSDGSEINIHKDILPNNNRVKNVCQNIGFNFVKKYDGIRDFSELKSKISNDAEGYVIRFENGFRMKIKGEEYVRLHKILTSFSNVDIWEYLKDGKPLNNLLHRVPDEFDLWVKNTVQKIEDEYQTLEKEYKWIFKVLMRSPDSETKKGFAELAKRYKHPSILFKMFDGKDYSDYIWKQIRPVYSRPFWQKELDT